MSKADDYIAASKKVGNSFDGLAVKVSEHDGGLSMFSDRGDPLAYMRYSLSKESSLALARWIIAVYE